MFLVTVKMRRRESHVACSSFACHRNVAEQKLQLNAITRKWMLSSTLRNKHPEKNGNGNQASFPLIPLKISARTAHNFKNYMKTTLTKDKWPRDPV